MVEVSSVTTISTHFRLGSFNFCTCFFTMASKARSGVKSPVLCKSNMDPEGNRINMKTKGRREGRMVEKEKENFDKERNRIEIGDSHEQRTGR